MTTAPSVVDLDIEGMSCASCAVRIEKRLNRIDGVTATVNFATERARVEAPGGVEPRRLLDAVADSGYAARVHAASGVPSSAFPARVSGALLARAGVALGVSLPLLLLGMVPALQFAGWGWLALVLATPVVGWCGWPLHRATAMNLRHGAVSMDTLVTVGTGAAYCWSLVVLAAGLPGQLFFDTAAVVTAFVLLGRWLEARSKRSAGASLRALLESGADEVRVIRGGEEAVVPSAELRVGELFAVRPGDAIASDGLVVDGHSSIDASRLTGEAAPVEVEAGSIVSGGTLNLGGRLVVRASAVGAETRLARIAALVEQAQSGKARAQRLADRVSAVFVPVVIVAAVSVLAAWLLAGAAPVRAFSAAVAVLVIACPCALGLATPVALLVGTTRSAQLGVLITGPTQLEATRGIDTVLLDKTGTVTDGRMRVQRVVASGTVDETELLRLAAPVERFSEHPIGGAIADAAARAGSAADSPRVEDFRVEFGSGVSARVDGRAVLIGSPRLIAERRVRVEGGLAASIRELADAGLTVVVIASDGAALGAIGLGDEPRPSSAAALAELRRLGLDTVLLTGDHEAAARRVADEVGIREVIAGVLPDEKFAQLRRLQAEGRAVAMIGDGVNDAAALAGADLGIAMGSGTEVAIGAADVTLVRDDLAAAVDAIRIARATLSTIRANLFWAFAYNVAALPLAALGLVDPMIAGAAMAASSLFVVGNSLRLRRIRPWRATTTHTAENGAAA